MLKFWQTIVLPLLLDAAGLAGVGFVSYGAWLAYKPAGFVVLGVLLIAAAWLLNKPEGN